MLNHNPIPRALHRPMMVMGCERVPVLSLAMICGGGVIAGLMRANILTMGLSVAVFALGLWGLREMAKADPMMFQVFIRAFKYKHFMAARSTPWSRR